MTVEAQTRPAGRCLVAPATVTVPGKLPVTVRTTQRADAELTGYVVLTRGAERRGSRTGSAPAPRPRGGEARSLLRKVGIHNATTKGGRTHVARYRYPESPIGFGFAAPLPGPERVFRVKLPRPVANFGVVVTTRAPGVHVEPRVVHAATSAA